jgi:hypothetical protein
VRGRQVFVVDVGCRGALSPVPDLYRARPTIEREPFGVNAGAISSLLTSCALGCGLACAFVLARPRP